MQDQAESKLKEGTASPRQAQTTTSPPGAARRPAALHNFALKPRATTPGERLVRQRLHSAMLDRPLLVHAPLDWARRLEMATSSSSSDAAQPSWLATFRKGPNTAENLLRASMSWLRDHHQIFIATVLEHRLLWLERLA